MRAKTAAIAMHLVAFAVTYAALLTAKHYPAIAVLMGFVGGMIFAAAREIALTKGPRHD